MILCQLIRNDIAIANMTLIRFAEAFFIKHVTNQRNESQYMEQVNKEKRVPELVGSTSVGAGYGPRQGWVDPDRGIFYVLNQMEPIVSVFKINEETGDLRLQSEAKIRTEGDAFSKRFEEASKKGELTRADGKIHESRIEMTPDSRLLFVSSRGVGAVTGFKVNQETGDLSDPWVSL